MKFQVGDLAIVYRLDETEDLVDNFLEPKAPTALNQIVDNKTVILILKRVDLDGSKYPRKHTYFYNCLVPNNGIMSFFESELKKV